MVKVMTKNIQKKVLKIAEDEEKEEEEEQDIHLKVDFRKKTAMHYPLKVVKWVIVIESNDELSKILYYINFREISKLMASSH